MAPNGPRGVHQGALPPHLVGGPKSPVEALHPTPTPVYAAPVEDGWTRTDDGATVAGRPARRWRDVKQAASILGTSSDAIRKRIARGTLPSRKLPDGSVQVRLDGPEDDQPGGGTVAGQASNEPPRRDELVENLQEQVRYLREVLNEERDARRRADTIIAQLTQANAFLARRVPELEAPSEQRESPQTAAEASGGAEQQPRPATEESQEAAEQRSGWWRRIFGG